MSSSRNSSQASAQVSVTAEASGWRLVGKIKEAHGLRGDLYVLIFSGEAAWKDELTEFCLAKDESLVNKKIFQVEKSKAFKKGLMIKPQGVPDRTAAELLKGQLFFIPENLLVADEGDSIFLEEIEGFQVLKQSGESIGPIVGFSTNTFQDLLVIKTINGKHVEVPFVDAFVVDIDHEAKQVIVDLPDGLLELDTSTKKDDGHNDSDESSS
jgi:16S rRNA processing protein RimM